MTDCKIPTVPICFWLPIDNRPVTDWPLSSSSSAPNYPVDNIKTQDRNLTWRSTVNTVSYIEGDNGDVLQLEPVDSLVVVNHKLGWDALIQIDLWDKFGAPLYSKFFSAKNYKALPDRDAIDDVRLYQSRVFHLGETISFVDKWRVTFSDSSLQSGPYFECGHIFLCKKFQPVVSWSDCPLFPVDKTILKETYGINISSDIRPKLRGLDISFDKVDNSDILKMLRLIHVVGRRVPIYVDPFPRIPEGNFSFQEEAEASKNLAWQMYGRQMSDAQMSPGKGVNLMTLPGDLKIIEEG